MLTGMQDLLAEHVIHQGLEATGHQGGHREAEALGEQEDRARQAVVETCQAASQVGCQHASEHRYTDSGFHLLAGTSPPQVRLQAAPVGTWKLAILAFVVQCAGSRASWPSVGDLLMSLMCL